ncbi:MAG: 16S rRNA (uracil(1498)-N(3))-methyltransferase [Sandaracinaceae bacterium]|nr:16S rRNA (uracil(1498)-N(3))-methyltransferase [Sandaracinaceae bacterium]
MNVVLVEPHELEPHAEGSSRVVLRDHRAAHLREVLKVSVGSRVRVGVIDGAMGHAEVIALAPDAITLVIGELPIVPSPPRLDLVLCLPRPKVLARLLSPLAQLGVHRVHLSGAWRVEKYYFDASILDPAEQRPLLLEGLAQAKDTLLPQLSVHRSFAWLVRTELGPATDEVLRIYADPGEHRSIREEIGAWPARGTGRVLLAIGPEGGFTDRERRELDAASFRRVGLGDRVLRSDVATVALLTLVHAALEEHARAPG